MLICRQPRIFDIDAGAVIAVAAICALTWLAGVQPLRRKAAERVQQQQQLLNEESSLNAEKGRLEKINHRQQALAARLSRTGDVLGANPGFPEIVRRLGALAEGHGLILNGLTPDETVREEYFIYQPMTVQLVGAFPTCCRFLDEVRQEMSFVRVAGMALGGEAQQPGQPCQIMVDLHAFGRRSR